MEVSLVQVDNTQGFPSCNLSGETKKIVGSSRELAVKLVLIVKMCFKLIYHIDYVFGGFRFNDLRIQRVINNDTNRKATKGKSNQARLLFCANLETVNGPLKLEACSQPITLGKTFYFSLSFSTFYGFQEIAICTNGSAVEYSQHLVSNMHVVRQH